MVVVSQSEETKQGTSKVRPVSKFKMERGMQEGGESFFPQMPESCKSTKKIKLNQPWTSPDVRVVSNTLLAKREKDKFRDSISLQRILMRGAPLTFSFPTIFAPAFIEWIEKLQQIFGNEENRESLKCRLKDEGKQKEVDFRSIWSSKDCLKLLNFHIRPWMYEVDKVDFRMWQEIDKQFHKMIKTKEYSFFWCGPDTYISYETLLKLKEVLRELVECK